MGMSGEAALDDLARTQVGQGGGVEAQLGRKDGVGVLTQAREGRDRPIGRARELHRVAHHQHRVRRIRARDFYEHVPRRDVGVAGDVFREDSDGYFWFVARADDMIISAGYNISGPEVENAVLGHAAVLECAVIGVPDEERGQIVKAYVVLKEGTGAGPDLVKDIQDFVKARIAPYKYPRAVEFAGALPKTPTGKLQRYKLREGTP